MSPALLGRWERHILWHHGSPGLSDVPALSLADILQLHIDGAVHLGPVRIADSQEVWPEAANHVFGQVGQGLADGPPKEKGPNHLVEGSQVIVEL